MPFAGIDPAGEKFDLDSCPGGFVQLKPMSWRQRLRRQDMMTQFQMRIVGKETEADINISNSKIMAFELEHCLVDHNLEDHLGNKYALPRDLDKIHPKIGEEIEKKIAKLNGFSEEDELPNSRSKLDDTSSPETQEA